jgi:hypothetical protein
MFKKIKKKKRKKRKRKKRKNLSYRISNPNNPLKKIINLTRKIIINQTYYVNTLANLTHPIKKHNKINPTPKMNIQKINLPTNQKLKIHLKNKKLAKQKT